MYAQAYYKLVEAVASAPVGFADLELNAYYLTVIKKIQSILSLPDFKDFPGGLFVDNSHRSASPA